MAVLVGTSGWQYRDWRGTYYPRELPEAGGLEHYARDFATVEVRGCAVRDAGRFAAIADELGLEPTRVPGREAVHALTG